MMPSKLIITTFLFLIGSLHTMVFSFFQFPDTFIADALTSIPMGYKAILYFFTISVSCFHQPIARTIGLKNVLIYGLLGNVLGLGLLYFDHFHGVAIYHAPLYLSVVLFGSSNLSVINSLVTYVILEFPSKTVVAITALFAFLNGGVMMTPLLLKWMEAWGIYWNFFFIIIGLLFLAMIAVSTLFSEPLYPKNLEHLRSGSLLWREMHKRLALFVLAIFLYSTIELTFSYWGSIHIFQYVPHAQAESASSLFWIFLIIGQLLLMLPLYYFEPREVYFFLVPLILFGLLYTPDQTQLSTISFGLAIGGLACAVVFPIFIALLEMEIIHIALMSHHTHYLPLIDTAVSFLMAGYLMGPAMNDLWTSIAPSHFAAPYFHLAIFTLFAITALMIYLDKSRKRLLSIKNY